MHVQMQFRMHALKRVRVRVRRIHNLPASMLFLMKAVLKLNFVISVFFPLFYENTRNPPFQPYNNIGFFC